MSASSSGATPLVPAAPERTVPVLQDWAQLVRISPRLYYRPADWSSVGPFVARVASGELGLDRLRVPGSLHSCSNIADTDQAMLDLTDLPRTMDWDPGDSGVTVSANWPLRDFLAALSARGKSITATGGTDEQSLAGLISTNTAPATPAHTVYELVDWIEYVTLDEAGSPRTRKVASGEPAFGGVMCSLGAIGVITRVHFKLVDELFFQTTQVIADVDDLVLDLDATSRKYLFWRVMWIQATNKGLLWAANPIAKSQAAPNGDYPPDAAEHWLLVAFKLMQQLDHTGARMNWMEHLLLEALELFYRKPQVFTGPMRNMLPVDRSAALRVGMAEWSFDPKDVAAARGAMAEYFSKNRWPNLPIEMELTKTDDYFMSPWHWPGLPYIVKFNFQYLLDVCRTPADLADLNTHLRGCWDYLNQKGLAFKAHWGKLNFLDPATVRRRYQLDQFRPMVNPAFVNPYLADRLGA
jgi:FAD/FMN-containing dehydrogenase